MSDVLKKSVDKKIHIEALRILAILFVVFNHTGTKGYMLFSQCQLGSIPFYCYLYISIFCKFAVPIFLAISGALILGREEEKLGIVWKKKDRKNCNYITCFFGYLLLC